MSARTRVLWLIAGLERGGAERLLCGLAERIAGRFAVEVAHVTGPRAPLAARLRDAGVAVHDLGAARTASPGWLSRCSRLVARRGFDVVHTHSPLAAAMARAAVGRGPAFVHTEHSPWRQHHRATRWANALTYPRNRVVVAVSTPVALGCARPPAALAGRWPRVQVVHHGSDQAPVAADARTAVAARRALGLADEAPVVGSVANFEAKKDHDTLLRAVARLRGDRPGLRCVLAGFGPMETRIRQRVAALGLQETVLFAGSRDDVPALLPAFDVFVHTPRFEGFGLAPLEAMAAGVPVVATAVDGVPELVGEQAGTLVTPGDDRAVAGAVARLLADPGLRRRMGAAGVERSRRFSLDAAARRIERVYDEVGR
jgi:glycosyltransferase involved in cell wall biosynthesis